MTERVDVEATGLLDGLEGTRTRRTRRTHQWLLDRGITVEQIRDSFRRCCWRRGGSSVTTGPWCRRARSASRHGIDLDLLQRLQRAERAAEGRGSGRGRCTCGSTARPHSRTRQKFVELGFSPDQIVLVVQVLTEGLARAADVMRYAALAAVMEPGATELDIAKRHPRR